MMPESAVTQQEKKPHIVESPWTVKKTIQITLWRATDLEVGVGFRGTCTQLLQPPLLSLLLSLLLQLLC